MEDTLKRALAIGLCAGMTLTGATAGIAGADGPSPRSVAAKACHQERTADPAAFQATYGPEHAMRNCIKTKAPKAEKAITNASRECRAERAADPEAFRTTYGANENGKNAFGKCVSKKAVEDLSDAS